MRTDVSQAPGRDSASVPSALQMAMAGQCPVCGESVEAFAEFNDRPKALCPTRGGVERQRVLALIYEDFLREEFDMHGKRVLAVSPSASETRLLERYDAGEVTSVDIRPEVSPDLVADICHMPEIPRMSYDCVIASYVLTCVYDLDAALAEIHR